MDPASANQKSRIIPFPSVNINQNRIYFEDDNGRKHYFLANLNDCNHTLVTATATLDSNYQILECDIEAVKIIDYQALKKQEEDLSLSDLFTLKEKLAQNERYILTLKEGSLTTLLLIEGHKIPVSISTLLDEFLKEDEEKYMDHIDLILDYICISLSNDRLYKSKKPLQEVEKFYQAKRLIKTKEQQIAG